MQNMPWTKSLLDDFIAEAMLSDREIKLMKMRIHGDSVVKQAQELYVSTSTVCRMVIGLRSKYDELHKQMPDRFPYRKPSRFEKYLKPALSNMEELNDYKYIIL